MEQIQVNNDKLSEQTTQMMKTVSDVCGMMQKERSKIRYLIICCLYIIHMTLKFAMCCISYDTEIVKVLAIMVKIITMRLK